MSILIDESTKYCIHGITGKQGSRGAISMVSAGSKIVCGVTPGKGGEEVEGIPVYNSVEEAKSAGHIIDCSVIYVPPRFAKPAILEALNAGVKLVNIITENISVHDMAHCIAVAKQNDARIIGATSAGIYSVGKSKSGSIAGGKAAIAFTPGKIGVISRSGGMSSETSLVLTQADLGQSTVVSIGSDILMGTRFTELVTLFETDSQTEGIVLFGEIGGSSEEDLADYLLARKEVGKPFTKPIVAFISGEFAAGFSDVSLGHAGAIIEGNTGTREGKVLVLKEAGVIVANYHHEVGELMKQALKDKKEGKVIN